MEGCITARIKFYEEEVAKALKSGDYDGASELSAVEKELKDLLFFYGNT